MAWLSSRPTQDALLPTPLAEALLHRHCARSTAAASKRCVHSLRSPCRAARARFAPWKLGRPPTEHASANGFGVVVSAANAGRAPPHAVGRGSSAPTPRQVGGCGFEASWPKLPNPVPRGPRALRPVENRPTAHGASALWRTWRGCLRGERAPRSTPRRWPRLFFTDTAPGRRLRVQNVVITTFESRGAGPLRASHRGEPADRPRSTRALADLAWLSPFRVARVPGLPSPLLCMWVLFSGSSGRHPASGGGGIDLYVRRFARDAPGARLGRFVVVLLSSRRGCGLAAAVRVAAALLLLLPRRFLFHFPSSCYVVIIPQAHRTRRDVTRWAVTTAIGAVAVIATGGRPRRAATSGGVARGGGGGAARCSAVTRDGGGCGMAAAVGRSCRAAVRVIVAVA